MLGGAPNSPAATVASPSPSIERSRPGSFVKSLPHTLLVTSTCPICSVIVTIETGAIAIIAESENLGAINLGIANQLASIISFVSTSPRKSDNT